MAARNTSKSLVPEQKDTDGRETSMPTQEEGWTPARAKSRVKKRGEPSPSPPSTTNPNQKRQQPGQGSTRTEGQQVRLKAGQTKTTGKEKAKADEGDYGTKIFDQLKGYAANAAPDHYVVDLMIRIKDHAKNRRLAAFIKHHKKENKDSDPVALRAEWEDAVPEHLTIKYQRIDSQWDAGNADHRSNLAHLVQTWLNDEKIGQRELETRLRFVHIAAPPTTSHVEGNSMEGKTGYLAAVTAERTMTAVEEQLTTEQARLRAICLEPAADRLTPRPMTEDEEAALLALFKHEFEVPAPPPFLLETMTSDEYARFEDNFLAIEYSLYAHLAPGQRFGDNMSRQSLLGQILAGPEAAEAQRIEVATFKKDLSRVSLDMRRRLIEVTFKGKSTAAKWAGWRMPLASRMVTLIDYESQREEALTTNALIRMDYYEFTVTVRSGAWTSTAIHRLFTTHFGMTIQKQNRTPSDAFGLSDRQWTLWVKFDTLPTNFRRLTYVTNDGKELLIHHNTVYANWPCKTCLEPDHPTRVCSLPKEKAEQCRRLHTKTITEAAPDCDGKASTGVKLPQTIDQLRRMLHLSSRRTNRKRDTSPKRTSTHKNKEGPSLPDSLKQYRSMTVPAEHQGEGCDTGRESNENPRERQDSQTNAEHTFKEERTPDARPKVDRSDHHDNGMEVDDDFNNPSSVAIPSISSQYIMSSAEQAGFAPAPTRPQEGAESTGSYGAPEASHNVHSTERQRVSPTRGRSPTRKTVGTGNPIVRGKTTLKQKVAKEVTKLLKRQTTEAKTKHHASTPKCRSASPKRKRAAQDTTVMESDVADRAGKWSKLSSKARSLSPTRRVEPTRGTAEDGTNGKNRLQSYMHSFLKTQDGLTESLSKVHTDSARPAESQTAPGHNLPEAPLTTTDPVACAAEEHLTDQGEVRVTEVRAATDPGAPVQEFLQVVSGTLVDVAANGHCGWLAFLAALNNTRHDLVNLSATVSKECNDTRKNVLNGILADLIDEMEVRPTEVEAQYTLSGYGSHINVPRPELLTSVMDHYIAQRKANVHTTVPRTMWVGPAQLKAMAIHARQPVFVLQVEREGNTRVQMYAYANYMLPNKKTKRKNKTKQGPKTPTKEQTSLTELGTVTMVPTDTAKLLLQELVDNGLLPLILVLQDQHFKAVVYDETRFQEYCALRKQLNQVRNAILKNYFGLEMDVIPFDTDRQAKAAQSSIRKIRGELLKFRASAEAKTTASRSEPVQKVSSPQPTADSSPSTPPPTLVSSGVAEAYTPTSAPQTTEREICKKMHTTIPVPNAGRPWSPPPTPDPGNHGMKDPGAQRDLTKEFRRQRRKAQTKRGPGRQSNKKHSTHKHDYTIGVTTANVRGLASQITNLGAYLQGIKESRTRGKRDITFLQETHLKEREQASAVAQYAALWGFSHRSADSLSFWASGRARAAGVAILVNPYGAFVQAQPWGKEHWNANLVMVQGKLKGVETILVNVYAPSGGAERAAFFKTLGRIQFPAGTPLLMGGDYNCVLLQEDRRNNGSGNDRAAAELAALVEQLGLIDAGFYNLPTALGSAELTEYACRHHTYRHVAATGAVSTSRLDRFYISASVKHWLRGVELEDAPCPTDHHAVVMELHAPDGPVRIKKRPKIYPAPNYVKEATRSLISAKLEDLAVQMDATEDSDLAPLWEHFKVSVKREMAELKAAAKRKMTNGYRQKILRLKRKLNKLDFAAADAERTRSEIIDQIQRFQAARRAGRRRVLVQLNACSSKASTRHFFRRICTKFGDSTVPTLSVPEGAPKRSMHDKANILADSWTPILNGEVQNKEGIADYVNKMSSRWRKIDLQDLDAPMDETEVRLSIEHGKPGKACGPDELGNAWYRDHVDKLVPILTKLFNAWFTRGDTPKSFLEAYIHSISKGGDRSNPLNYRPIALLNSDYKIFTRILAWRVRNHISQLVHPTQFGFVPGKTIHEAIDLYEAAKILCGSRPELHGAEVLLLDFAKAYDSLNRSFLLEVLRAKGFPPKFCAMIYAIHEGTAVQFLANGSLSSAVPVTSGIRQGCPLAPLLFILAVDLLYDEVEATAGVHGLNLGDHEGVVRLDVAGYADDSAIYLADKSMQAEAILAVGRFSAVSGLCLNVKKSAAIALGRGPEEIQGEPDHHRQEVPQVQSTRYLGHIAGSGNITEMAWTKAAQALRVRLLLTETKTTTVEQRARIAAAIIIPKLLYVARHAWPSEDVIKNADARIKNYVWRAQFTIPDTPAKGWVSSVMAMQETKWGGLGVPNLRLELIALSASTVGDWTVTLNPYRKKAGDILMSRENLSLEPLVQRSHPPAPKVRKGLRSTGRPWTEFIMNDEVPFSPDFTAAAGERWTLLKNANGLISRWAAGGLKFTCSDSLLDQLRVHTKARRAQLGFCCLATIEHLHTRHLALWTPGGDRAQWKHYKLWGAAPSDRRVRDILTITTTKRGEVYFKPTGQQLPMASLIAHQFREICLAVLANYPELVFRTQEVTELHVQHPLQDKGHLFRVERPESNRILHTWGFTTTNLVLDGSDSAVERAVGTHLEVENKRVSVAPHPWLTRMRPLWVGRRRWRWTRKDYKKVIYKTSAHAAIQTMEDKQRKWVETDPTVAKVLTQLQWSHIHKLEGATPYQIQNLVRLRHNRLRLWAGNDRRYACTATECAKTAKGGTAHLVWECPEARKLWTAYVAGWGISEGLTAECLRDILTLQLRTTPPWLLSWGEDKLTEHWEILHEVALEMWRLGIALTVTTLWRRNVDRIHPVAEAQVSIAEAVAIWRSQLHEAYQRYRLGLYPLTPQTEPMIQVASQLIRRWNTETFSKNARPETDKIRIGFFDGGSRGNPGPGGSGSVIVEVDAATRRPTIVWAAATALGNPDTTNNIAEFVGLQRLLQHAHRKKWVGLAVVGDSQLILTMLQQRKLPRAARLQNLYRNVRRLADLVNVTTWQHHYRRHNKMADWLANLAMDTKRSQASAPAGGASCSIIDDGLKALVSGDIAHWARTNGQ